MAYFVENGGRKSSEDHDASLGLLPWVLGFAGTPGTSSLAVLFQVWVSLSAGLL